MQNFIDCGINLIPQRDHAYENELCTFGENDVYNITIILIFHVSHTTTNKDYFKALSSISLKHFFYY